jgi:hypothetical protein
MASVLLKAIYTGSDTTALGELESSDTASVPGPLTVTGAATLSSTLAVTGVATLFTAILNQGTNDGEILAFKSSDVAHGATTITETNTFTSFRKLSATGGGLRIDCISSSIPEGMWIFSTGTGEDTDKNSGADGTFVFDASKVSGTGRAAIGANGNLVSFQNNGTTRALLDAEGDWHLDATSNENVWDDHDDVALIAGLRGSLMGQRNAAQVGLSRFVDAARPVLEQTGVVTYNEDGHHFISMKGALFLTMDTVRQVHTRAHTRMDAQDTRIAAIERRLLAA